MVTNTLREDPIPHCAVNQWADRHGEQGRGRHQRRQRLKPGHALDERPGQDQYQGEIEANAPMAAPLSPDFSKCRLM
jgi:hypothetical protein